MLPSPRESRYNILPLAVVIALTNLGVIVEIALIIAFAKEN